MTALHAINRAHAEQIVADGGGWVFGLGVCTDRSFHRECSNDCQRTLPPASFVEACQPCGFQHVESGGGPGGTNLLWHVTGNPDNNGLDPADCHDGRPRCELVVPCLTCHPFNGDPADDSRCQTCGIKYHCARCNHPCNMMATGHGPGLCERHDGLITVATVVAVGKPLRVSSYEWDPKERTYWVQPEQGPAFRYPLNPDCHVGQWGVMVEVLEKK